MTAFKVIIPARYASTRLPGKALLDIAGKPLLQHVYEATCASDADEVYIATDDERIVEAAKQFGARAIMTSEQHLSGTDRLAELVTIQGNDDSDIIVNVQGDELGLSPKVINQVAHALIDHADINMSTVCEAISSVDEVIDPNIVKVVMDKNNRALYFSRAPIPWDRQANGDIQESFNDSQYYRHIGLYGYRAGFLKQFASLPKCALEEQESLEQLRALYNGESIYVALAREATGIGVDTEDDLQQARERFVKD